MFERFREFEGLGTYMLNKLSYGNLFKIILVIPKVSLETWSV